MLGPFPKKLKRHHVRNTEEPGPTSKLSMGANAGEESLRSDNVEKQTNTNYGTKVEK